MPSKIAKEPKTPEQMSSDPDASRTMRARLQSVERSGSIDLVLVAIAATLAVVAEIMGTTLTDRTWALLLIVAGIGRFGLIRYNGSSKPTP